MTLEPVPYVTLEPVPYVTLEPVPYVMPEVLTQRDQYRRLEEVAPELPASLWDHWETHSVRWLARLTLTTNTRLTLKFRYRCSPVLALE